MNRSSVDVAPERQFLHFVYRGTGDWKYHPIEVTTTLFGDI